MSREINKTIIDQIPMMKRTKKFIKKYGLKVIWVAEKTDIPVRRLSCWINGNELLYAHQFDRLKDFLDEYEKCLSTFSYLQKENEP